MPEGHVIHRAARLQGRRFKGKMVSVSSPQGRFRDGAATLDGRRIERMHAYGKHLFYDFDNDLSVHIHLGLFGKFRLSRLPAKVEPSPNCRLLIESETDQLHLAGPTVCELVDAEGIERIVARLGPDPILDPPDGADRLAQRLSTRSIPIGAALLDQKVIAGIGNVYRAEFLHTLGIHPFIPAKQVRRPDVDAIWSLAVDELRAGEALGRIVTVDPAEVGRAKRSDIPKSDRLYAYKRQGKPCRRCGTPIVAADIDGRNIWWCPTCQPE
ncbi:MAG: DNA-formamidopyrimidine glycosylase family protein [Acidimicrobiales bacterium]